MIVEFYVARSHAINEYARLEMDLFFLFAELMQAQHDYAAIPFFKINNARARKEILEKMLRKRRGDKYGVFWNSLGNHLTGLDQKRNEVVHWAIVGRTAPNTPTRFTLNPPAWWSQEPATVAAIDRQQLLDFADKCAAIRELVLALLGELIEPKLLDGPWPQIFAEPVLYPIPAGHPLCRKP